MNITGIDLKAIAEAAEYRELGYQMAMVLVGLVVLVAWAKKEGAWE